MKTTNAEKSYALLILKSLMNDVRETCEECEDDVSGDVFCGCGVNGGDLVDAVGEEIANLESELASVRKKK